ncbi:MAG TPA: amidohydrolase family protein [Gemmatimonadaceae bacterium]|jgi:imidazolonepropionase-like amidohydrolase|nr:amidohydrolase family protein [Gemmatimonadaceae bacterium]
MRLSAFHLLAAACAIAGAHIEPAGAQTKALRFAAVVDGSGPVIANGVVIVDGDKITRVLRPSDPLPPNAQVIDLTRFTAIPGMIDLHTHMTYYWDPASGTDPWRQPPRPPAQTVQLARQNAMRTLEIGVTAVRDLGSSNYTDIALRDSIDKAGWMGPRMFVAGYGLSHARAGGRGNVDTTKTTRGRVFNISQIPEAVKQQVDAGADYVKMYGSTGSGADVTGTETFNFDEMKAAVDAAHALGKRIAIHTYGPVGGRDATFAGANSVEHPIDLDDATLDEMVRRGTVYVPTIDHNRYYAEYAKDFRYTTEQVAALDSFRLLNYASAARAFKKGVKLGMGSDAVFTMFGQNTRELGWFVKLGMTPAQALATCTTTAAALLGMENSLGRIAPGYYADIAAVEGNPMTDINAAIYNVKWVMKGGAVVVDKTR